MKVIKSGLGATVIAVSALWASGIGAQESRQAQAPHSASTNAMMRYPAGSIRSIETADLALAEVHKERAEVEAQFASEERTCYQRFFAALCVDEAKERRRQVLSQLRSIEIEASRFKRQARVSERDRALATRTQESPADKAGMGARK